MKFDRIDIQFTILCIDSHINSPSPPKSLDILLLCPTVDPQLRVDARSGKHNIAPASAHKHQIRLGVWIVLDRVQKDLGEYFYRPEAGDFLKGRQLIGVRQQIMTIVESGREEASQAHARVARADVRPSAG